tara:strand:+ start:2778 stop:3926 length:1149 start_codon:yes stop_codon:yes gene_type:complete
MPRNRVIYQSDIVFVGNTGATGTGVDTGNGTISQLQRVQSANYSFDIARTDINQFGQLAAVDRIILEQPTVSLDLNYLVLTGDNETNIGLTIGGNSAISHILSGDDLSVANRRFIKNYYIATAVEGSDAANASTNLTGANASIIGIGNCFLSSYTVNGSVGDFVSADVSVEGLNMTFEATSGQASVENPLVDPTNGDPVNHDISMAELNGSQSYTTGNSLTPAALRPGNVTVDAGAGVVGFETGATNLKYQNFSIGFDLSRENLEKLGSRFAFSKEIEFPAEATMDFSALVGDVNSNASGAGSANNALDHIVNESDASHTVSINVSGNDSERGLTYTLLGGKLSSQSISSSIGDNKSVDLSYVSQIGGPEDTTNGIKITGLA